MDETDLAIQQEKSAIAAIESRLAAAESQLGRSSIPVSSTAAESQISQSSTPSLGKQFLYDVGFGALEAGAGLGDILGAPLTGLARLAGADPETTRYFPLSKELQNIEQKVAAEYGLEPDTEIKTLASFLTGGVKAGLPAYAGMKTGEAIAPESPYAGIVGALAPGALGTAAKGVATKLAPSMVTKGKALQRAQFGSRQGDYTAKKNTMIELAEDEFVTQLDKSADNLIEQKVLPRTSNPDKLYPAVQTAKKNLEKDIQATLKTAQKKVGTIEPPPFERAMQYIQEGKVPANEVDDYLKEIIDFQEAVAREGKGSLAYLNNQRKAIGENWSNKPNADAGFWRAFYRDIKNHIEKYAPEIEGLHKKKQDLVVIEPVIERAKKANQSFAERLNANKWFYTTSTLGLPGALMVLGPAGIPVALGLAAAGTKPGRMTIGRALQAAGERAQAPVTYDLASALRSAGVAGANAAESDPIDMQIANEQAAIDAMATRLAAAEQQIGSSQATPTATATPTETSVATDTATATPEPTQPVEATPTITVEGTDYSLPTGDRYASPDLVKAVIAVESSGKRGQVSPKGARGLMQIMPETAKELGIDPTDPEQNIEGGSRYLKTLINRFDNVELALAAYNWGQGNIANALKKLRGEGREATWENIKRYNSRLPSETRKYVGKVLSNMRA